MNICRDAPLVGKKLNQKFTAGSLFNVQLRGRRPSRPVVSLAFSCSSSRQTETLRRATRAGPSLTDADARFGRAKLKARRKFIPMRPARAHAHTRHDATRHRNQKPYESRTGRRRTSTGVGRRRAMNQVKERRGRDARRPLARGRERMSSSSPPTRT